MESIVKSFADCHLPTVARVRPATLTAVVYLTVLIVTRSALGDESNQQAILAEPTGKPWIDMNYGPTLTMSVEVSPDNIAYKGICVRLDPGPGGISAGQSFAAFDTDTLRYAAAWHGEGFIDWEAINFNGEHGAHPSATGKPLFNNPVGPGWARPDNNSWVDSRVTGRDGKHYGPLKRDWAHYKGLYHHGQDVVFHYTVGDTEILDKPGIEESSLPLVTRTIDLAARSQELIVQVAHAGRGNLKLRRDGSTSFALLAAPDWTTGSARRRRRARSAAAATCVGLAAGSPGEWIPSDDGQLRLRIPAGEATVVKIVFGQIDDPGETSKFVTALSETPPAAELEPYTQGGPRRWRQQVTTQADVIGPTDGPYVSETISLPHENPYNSWMRLGGFDFFADGRRAAVCTWQGDVWLVDGLGGDFSQFTWQRIASGLFQPLGLKIIDGAIYVLGRDQITILRDFNGDGEADYYENFNNDAQVTQHFHEFAVDLQVDDQGNLYYAKCARHALDAIVPQHGTLLKVAADGSSTEILARGFRAANGVCLNPDGSFYLTDQEGHWTPKNRLNRVVEGGFYGNMMAYHEDRNSDDFLPPVCWIHNNYDRSPAAQIWVDSERWGPLEGGLLCTSYGTGQIQLALVEQVGETYQGGLVRMPIPDFPTGIMRGRFNQADGQFYCCGLFGWSSNKTEPGGFYRVRYTGAPMYMPTALKATEEGLVVTFSAPVDPNVAGQPGNYAATRWQYRRTADYGSDDYRISNPRREGRDRVAIEEVDVSDDGRSVLLRIPDMQPAMQMELKYRIEAANGTTLAHTIHHTVHQLGAPGQLLASTARPSRPIRQPTLDEQQLETGLVLTLASRESSTSRQDLRSVRIASLFVPVGEPPSPFLPVGPFDAELDGHIVLDLGAERTFSVEGRGEAALYLNGSLILQGSGDLGDVEPVEVPLAGGTNQLRVIYASPRKGDAALRVLWSNPGEPAEEGVFPAEPIPPAQLRYDPRHPGLVEATQLRQGRALYATHQCHRCHLPASKLDADQLMPELALDTPSLKDVGQRFRRQWLYHWVQDPQRFDHQAAMPQMLPADGPAARQAAVDLVAYLCGESDAPPEDVPTASDDELIDAGEVLHEDLGCIACHHFSEPGELDEFQRVSLYFAATKYRPAALVDFLRAPHAYHASRQMPDFRLSVSEARQLAAFITSQSRGELDEVDLSGGSPERGRIAFEQHGCQSCHALQPEQVPWRNVVVPLNDWQAADDLGCLAAKPDDGLPRYDFDPTEIEALIALLETHADSLESSTCAESSRRLVKALRCTACHGRDGQSNDLTALVLEEGVQGLPPQRIPDLTYTGEKLKRTWMRPFIEGRLSYQARPWLRSRMPGFGPYAAVLARGLPAENGYSGKERAEPEVDRRLAKIGHDLTLQSGGFFCVECHASDQSQPITAFERHRGIDFPHVAERLQYDYYMRWLLAPKRIDPLTSMPEFAKQPKPNVLDGEIEEQFEAIWHYLNEIHAAPPASQISESEL